MRIVEVEEPVELTLAQELRVHLAAGVTPEEAATAVLAPYRELRVHGRLWPLLLADARVILRNMTRRDERRLLRPDVITDQAVREAVQARLAERSFVVAGQRLKWVEATAAQHRARAAWLELQAHGIAVTQRLHVAAAEVIEAHGVQCLGEIPDYAARLAERCGGEIPAV